MFGINRVKLCKICKENLLTKFGTCVASVSLFTETCNKEFKGVLGGKPVVLANLLQRIGIFAVPNNDESVCKKCARKVVNCYKLFQEMRIVFVETSDTNPSAVSQTPEKTAKSTRTVANERSPTGFTPSAKRQKPTENQKPQDNSVPSARKSIFGKEKATSEFFEQEHLTYDDTINSLMNIPTNICGVTNANLPPIVKIFICYPQSCRVFERSCEDKCELAMVKHLCLENYKAAANSALKFPPFRREILNAVNSVVKQELRDYSKGKSTGRYNGDPLSLGTFNNEELLESARMQMPWIHSILTNTSKAGVKYENNKQSLALSAVLNTWIPRSNFIYRINTLLIAGCCRKEVMDLFHRLGLSSHPNTIRRQLECFAQHYDSEILVWKDAIERNRKKYKLLQETLFIQTATCTNDDMVISTVDFSRSTVERYRYFNEETYKSCLELLPPLTSNALVYQDSDFATAANSLSKEKLPLYRIVGDNIDLEQTARIQSHKRPNQSLHWFQIYAVKDRVMSVLPDISQQKTLKDLQMKEFLPTPEVHAALIHDLTFLIPRILLQYLPAYQSLKNAVIYHIPHNHSAEMKAQSHVCSLGLEFKNPNIAVEMAQIMKNIQEKFVPMTDVDGKAEILQRVFLDGDQLTEERARNAQLANTLADTPTERLSGLETSFADWHLGKNMLMILFKLFVKESSAAEIGTSYASMNRNGKTNAKKGPDKDYNAYQEFFDRETEAHIVARWMEFAGMQTHEDTPMKRPIPDLAMWTVQEKASWLGTEIKSFLHEVLQPYDVAERIDELDAAHRQEFACRSEGCAEMFLLHSSRVRHEVLKHPGLEFADDGDLDRDKLGYYKCRQNDCPYVFTTKATRKRHESLKHDVTCDAEQPVSDQGITADPIQHYHNARLQCGLLMLNMMDAIKEGDGNRLVRCYKIILLFQYKFHHTKYAFILLLFFAKIYALLSEKEAYLLIHNRFVNKKGKKAGNIALDLHMEHLNLDVKKLLRAMGGNITEAAAQRSARSMTVLNNVLDSTYEECDKFRRAGYHDTKKSAETVYSITQDLMQGNVFTYTPGRDGYKSFKNFKSNIIDIDYRDFFAWAREHLKQWEGVYETPSKQ